MYFWLLGRGGHRKNWSNFSRPLLFLPIWYGGRCVSPFVPLSGVIVTTRCNIIIHSLQLVKRPTEMHQFWRSSDGDDTICCDHRCLRTSFTVLSLIILANTTWRWRHYHLSAVHYQQAAWKGICSGICRVWSTISYYGYSSHEWHPHHQVSVTSQSIVIFPHQRIDSRHVGTRRIAADDWRSVTASCHCYGWHEWLSSNGGDEHTHCW